MGVTETLDREAIIERAEEVRLWLLGFHLSNRATGAIQRELGAIIDNVGTAISEQRPLAGLTVAEFVAELHRPDGGAVGRVKSVGYTALNELRTKIPEGTVVESGQALNEPEYTVPDVDVAEAAEPAPVAGPPQADAEPQPVRRRGRPKGSTKAARNGAAAHHAGPTPAVVATLNLPEALVAEPKRRRGRPRREQAAPAVAPSVATVARANGGAISVAPVAPELPSTPAASPVAPAAHDGNDPMLHQIIRLWPTLHPHARRAVVMYASELWVEAGYEV